MTIKERFRDLKESATLNLNQRSKALQAEGEKVFRFGLGQSPFPVPEIVVEELRKYAGEKDYLPGKGLPALREAVAGYHRRRDGLDVSADQVLIGPGSKDLLFLTQFLFEGKVFIPAPCWVSYGPQASIAGNEYEHIQTSKDNSYRLQPQELTEAIANHPGSKLLMLNYPGNPLGNSYSEEDLKALADVARENNLFILSDEIYGATHHDGNHMSIAKFYPEGTIITAGLSKWCGAGGWRIGTIVFPKEMSEFQNSMSSAISETYSSVSAPTQNAAVKAFEEPDEVLKYVEDSRKIIKALAQYSAAKLRDSGIEVVEPEGGFYLFMDFSSKRDRLQDLGINSSIELCEYLLKETGIAILPGSAFGRSGDELNARLAYVDFDGGKALEGFKGEVGESFLSEYCQPAFEGIGVLAEWFETL